MRERKGGRSRDMWGTRTNHNPVPLKKKQKGESK
jgi:hypothetical protein